MATTHDFARLFLYDHWANQEVTTALRRQAAASPPQRAVRFVAHIAAAEQLWLDRLENRSATVPVWPDWDLDASGARFDALRGLWGQYLAGLGTEGLEASRSYVNSKGEHWTSLVRDVLLHVVMHAAYHRGQVAIEMRAAGLVPAYTDFIQGVRAGHVPE